MTVYLSGPITGVLGYERRFAAAERWAREKYPDAVIVNPAKESEVQKAAGRELTWSEWMQHWIRYIVSVQPEVAIMLRGWQASKGAAIEHTVLRLFGAQIIYPDKKGDEA